MFYAIDGAGLQAPEALARENIDVALRASGWVIQDARRINLYAACGVAVREFHLPGHGEADYLLFVDREKTPEGRWRKYTYDELMARDKATLDIFWLHDASLQDGANLPAPEVIAAEIVEDLRAALEEFELISLDLAQRVQATPAD